MSNNLLTINNQFEFNFPVDFVKPEIEQRYLSYIKSKRKLHSSIREFLNSTVLSISFPSLTFNTVSNEQILHRKKIKWKAVDNVYDLFSNSITVTFNDVDSHINYFILMDILTTKYLDTDKAYDENIMITIVDENRNALYHIQFRDVIWTNLSDITLGYNEQSMGAPSFTAEFTYNFIDIKWVDSDTDIISENIYTQ